jgi:hypothetical protein
MADDRSWRGGDAGPEGRTRSNSPYGDEDRQRSGEHHDRGFLERAGEGVRSWFGGHGSNGESGGSYGGSGGGAQSWGQAQDEPGRGHYGAQGGGRHTGQYQGYGAEHGTGGFQGDYRGGQGQGGFGGRGDWEGGRQSFSGGSSHPMDDHYRSWRDRHIAELDRDYEDYCRENRQDFHSSFNSWRENRRPASGGQSHGVPGSSGELATGAAVTARPSDMAGGGATSGTSGSTGSSAEIPESGTKGQPGSPRSR